MRHQQWNTASQDGSRIQYQSWQPENPCAVVCLVHGLGEHSGRYPHVVAALTSAGLALLAFDLPGHGTSSGPRGHAPAYEKLLDHLDDLLTASAKKHPGLPRFLYGHSLGGNLVINYLLRRHPDIAGAIATGPALRPALELPPLKLALGRFAARVWPGLRLHNELEIDAICRDPEVVQAYRSDPLVHDRVSARLGIEVLASGEWALAHADRLRAPLLLMHGSADRLTSPSASREFAARAGTHCTLRSWDGMFHELHNEPERQQVLTAVIEWLRVHGSEVALDTNTTNGGF